MKSYMKISFSVLSVFILLILSYGCASQQKRVTLLKDQEICQEIKSGKMWQVGRGGKFTTLQEAERYAESLQLGGYNDWRVPTWDEYSKLHNIIFSLGNNNDCAMDFNGDFWTMLEGKKPALGHWEVYFLCGTEIKYVESSATDGYVRAVRP